MATCISSETHSHGHGNNTCTHPVPSRTNPPSREWDEACSGDLPALRNRSAEHGVRLVKWLTVGPFPTPFCLGCSLKLSSLFCFWLAKLRRRDYAYVKLVSPLLTPFGHPHTSLSSQAHGDGSSLPHLTIPPLHPLKLVALGTDTGPA